MIIREKFEGNFFNKQIFFYESSIGNEFEEKNQSSLNYAGFVKIISSHFA